MFIKNFLYHRSYFYSIFNQLKMIRKNQRLGYGKIFSINKIKKFKKSDTLFVMGSGPSICDMPDKYFDHIASNDSFGFTNWTMHDHVPTYYMNEFKFKNDEMIRCAEQELFNLVSKKDLYKDTALIFRAGSTEFNKINRINELGMPFENIYLAMDIGVYGNNIKKFNNSLSFLYKIGILNSNYFLLQKTASLFRVIIFGYKLGYEKIVLCGIDLTGDQYFWEKEKNKYKRKPLMFPKLISHRTSSHKTNNIKESTGGMIISDIVHTTHKSLLKPKNIKLEVASDSSFFYPTLNLYDWKKSK